MKNVQQSETAKPLILSLAAFALLGLGSAFLSGMATDMVASSYIQKYYLNNVDSISSGKNKPTKFEDFFQRAVVEKSQKVSEANKAAHVDDYLESADFDNGTNRITFEKNDFSNNSAVLEKHSCSDDELLSELEKEIQMLKAENKSLKERVTGYSENSYKAPAYNDMFEDDLKGLEGLFNSNDLSYEYEKPIYDQNTWHGSAEKDLDFDDFGDDDLESLLEDFEDFDF